MPESAEQIHVRAAGELRVPPVEEWDSWPFEGELRPKALRPPEPDPVIQGTGGVDCPACDKPDGDSCGPTRTGGCGRCPSRAGCR